jgi:hypothetical protein
MDGGTDRWALALAGGAIRMGETFFIVAEPTAEGGEFFPVGEALIHCGHVGAKGRPGRTPLSHLDALAREAGVRPLTEFLSEDLESAGWRWAAEGGEPPPGALPPEQWFTAAEGLATVRGLLDYLTTHTEAAAEVKRVIGELRQFEKVLRQFEDEGVLWHLEDGFWW